MNKDYKDLLLKDLCARLPYGVKVKYAIPTLLVSVKNPTLLVSVRNDSDGIKVITEDTYIEYIYNIEDIKPYLRPMSSMTEEEKIKLYQIAGFYYLSNNELLKDEWIQFSGALSENKLFLPYPIWEADLNKAYDWLNAYHFDYRNLIEKGLALEAPEGMYNV